MISAEALNPPCQLLQLTTFTRSGPLRLGWNPANVTKLAGLLGLALGNYYADEEGGSQDIKQAFKWYEKGAEYGCSRCQANLGWCCCRLEDFATAAKWLFISAVLGAEKGKDLFNLLFVVATNEQYEDGCQQAMEWLDGRSDADEDRVHYDLRNWMALYRDDSQAVLIEIDRVRRMDKL